MTTAGTISPAARLSPPVLRVARFDDYMEIARLESQNSLETQPESDWRGVWLDNPLWPKISHRWPIGWVLESPTGEIVGSVLNVPSIYTFRGRELVCANGRAWVAKPEYRALALMLMDEYFNQDGADIFINTTVGPMATEILSALATRVPVGDWESISYWITHYRGFARTALRKMRIPLAGLLAWPTAGALRLKDAILNRSLPALPCGFSIDERADFDSRFDGFWEELVSLNPHKLLALRDRAMLAWHFAIPFRRRRAWIVTASRNGLLRAYCILKRQDQNQGIPRVRLVDFQTLEPDVDLLPGMLNRALQRCRAEGIYIFDLLGRDLPKMRGFDEFAPYQRKLSTWPYYYRSNDPALSAELVQPGVWDPSSYDGDASFE